MSPLTRAARKWWGGLIAAAASGAAGVMTLNFVDPGDFNLENPKKLAAAVVCFALSHVFGFLQRSPLPDVTIDKKDTGGQP